MNFYLRSTRFSMMGSALLLNFLVLGFFLANKHIIMLMWPCSCGVLLHAGYFLGLYILSFRYGTSYRHKIALMTISIMVFFCFWVELFLKLFPSTSKENVAIALWEAAPPVEVMLTWVCTYLGTFVPWYKKYPKRIKKHLVWCAVANTLCAGLFGHLLAGVGLYRIGQTSSELICGNALGYLLAAVLCGSIIYITNRFWHFLPVYRKKKAPARIFWSFQFFLMCFCGACLFSGLYIVKHLAMFHVGITAALFTYVFTFIFSDVLSEVYGHVSTKLAIWAGWFTNISLLIIVLLLGSLPCHPDSPGDNLLFHRTFKLVASTVIASMLAYFISQFLDIYLFAKLKKKTKGRHLWLRNNVATIVSQLVDTLVFFAVHVFLIELFFLESGNRSHWAWWYITINEYFGKVFLALLDTPIVYLLIHITRRWNRAKLNSLGEAV